jgi:NADH-quinone oxidoreductase subunit N
VNLEILRPLTLPLAVSAAAVLVLLADAVLPDGRAGRGKLLGWLTAALLGGVLVASFFVDTSGTVGDGVYVGNAWATFFARLFLVAGVLGVLGAMDHLEQQSPRRHGEYYMLLLFSIVGMLIVPGARDLLLLIVAFELMGLPLYIMAAYAKTDARKVQAPTDAAAPVVPTRSPAAEAAIKLYLVGATSTAITMFGMALVVGMAGTTRLTGVLGAEALAPVSVVGLMLILAGLSFKIGLVPFHMWVPDTYEGAPTPFVAFLSVAPKAGGIAALVVVFLLGTGGHPGPWTMAIAVLAAGSMTIGNLLAVPQTDARRLLGYSGVAQMGYVLLAVATGNAEGLSMSAFYLAAYVFSNMGAFLVVHAVAADGGTHDLKGLAGLSKRSPWLGVALLAFLLSLAGIPFMIGFWAKLFVFLAAYRAGLVGLVVLGAVLAVVGLFYYLQVARAAFMVEPTVPSAPRVGGPLRAAIVICLLVATGLGLWPGPLHEAATAAGSSLSSALSTGTPPASDSPGDDSQ